MGWIMAGIAIAGIGASVLGGKSAAKGAKQSEQERARAAFAKNEEDIRRREIEIEREIGANYALLRGATGVRFTPGSTGQTVIKNMRDQYADELAWQRKYGQSVLQAGLSTASSRYRTDLINTLAGALGSVAGVKQAYDS